MRPLRRPCGWPLIAGACACLLLAAAPAGAGEVTQVATALEDDKPVEAFLSVAYEYWAKRAAIKREYELSGFSGGAATTGGIGTYKDLRYTEDRHTMRLRGEIGFAWDTSLHIEAPIVISDTRSLSFDQSAGSGCVFPQQVPAGSSQSPTCVNELNSSTLRDGLVPGQFGQLNSPHGVDATRQGQMFTGGDPTVFRGPTRYGLESLNRGIDWAVLNQRKDDTKPTWVLAAELRFSLGTPMRFDRTAPAANTSVTDGVHWLKLGTTMSKRWSVVEPYASFWWLYPLYVRDDSQFQNYGGGQKDWRPQQRAGTFFGFEAIPWEAPKQFQRISIDVRGFVEARFQGRGYSEIWEMLSGSPALDPQAQPSGANGQPVMKGGPHPGATGYPGVTDIENYFMYGGQIGLNVRVGRYVKFRGLFGMTGAQKHFITFADAGNADPSTGVVSQSGSAAEREVNPIHRPLIDYVGRRYVVDETVIYSLFLQGEVLF
jgi:hypothetical protein